MSKRMNSKMFWKYGVVLACVLVVVILSLGCLQKESEEAVSPTPVTDKEEPAMMMIPEELVIYLDYLGVIGGKSRISDIGTIEATMLSVTKTEICPDKTDPFASEPTECSIEPYPKDFGIVRIDKIINYTPYSEQTIKPTVEQPSGGESPEEGDTTQGYEGPEYPSEGKEYKPLQEGQEVSTHFLLTVRPAKVRYVPINESVGGMESAQESGNTNSNSEQDIISHVVTPEEKIFKPIPKDGSYYAFTTKIGNFPETIEKNLPGLEVGSKFRAEIWYDGSLYVEEYEVIE